MKIKKLLPITLIISCILMSCKEKQGTKIEGLVGQELSSELEEQAILDRLNNETKDAF